MSVRSTTLRRCPSALLCPSGCAVGHPLAKMACRVRAGEQPFGVEDGQVGRPSPATAAPMMPVSSNVPLALPSVVHTQVWPLVLTPLKSASPLGAVAPTMPTVCADGSSKERSERPFPPPLRGARYLFDRAAYKRRNVIERLPCRLKNWRRVGTRYTASLETIFSGLALAAIIIA
jgi:hypothetical protein